MAPEDKTEDQEEELVPVGEGVEEEEEQQNLEDELDEEEHDERMGAGEDDEDEEDPHQQKLAKRREERKARKQRQKDARARDEREMNFLRQRNEQLERRFSELDQRVGHSEVAQVDTRITDIKSKIKLADQVISKAIGQQDGEAYTEAQGIRDNLRDQLTQLEGARNYMTQQREVPQGPDPRLMQHASAWMSDHAWWDPNGGDEDSRTVSALDAQLVREGFDPTTQEYWDTLSDRVEEALPHRFGGGGGEGNGQRQPGKKRSSGGPSFRTGGRERPLKKGEVYISPERKQAMIEAGVWEDPELRQKYLKSYQTYDREHGQA